MDYYIFEQEVIFNLFLSYFYQTLHYFQIVYIIRLLKYVRSVPGRDFGCNDMEV